MSAHTPGPWQVTGQAESARYIVVRAVMSNGKPGRIVARVPFNKEGDVVYTDASDANLIAAAPDLLAALLAIYRADASGNNGAVMGESVLCNAFATQARAALAKAGVL